MDMVDVSDAVWGKSSRSSGNGACVEIAYVGERADARDSKNPVRPVLVFAPLLTKLVWMLFTGPAPAR